MADTIKINRFQLQIDIPKGFRQLSMKDRKAMGGSTAPNNWVVTDKEKQQIYNITWKKIPLLGRLIPPSGVASVTREQIKNQLPSFKSLGDVKRMISDVSAVGFRYSYTANGTARITEYLLVKYRGFYIAFTYGGHEECFDKNYESYSKMLDSVRFT